MPQEKRRAEDRIPMMGLLAGAPWWFRALIFVLFTFLGPSILATFLLLAAFGMIDSPVTQTHDLVERLQRSQSRHSRMLRLLCRRTAKTEAHLTECEQAMRVEGQPSP